MLEKTFLIRRFIGGPFSNFFGGRGKLNVFGHLKPLRAFPGLGNQIFAPEMRYRSGRKSEKFAPKNDPRSCGLGPKDLCQGPLWTPRKPFWDQKVHERGKNGLMGVFAPSAKKNQKKPEKPREKVGKKECGELGPV